MEEVKLLCGRRASAHRYPPGTPNPVDVHVGSQIRLRRTLLGLSEDKLGQALGLTFQQVQKYERGANRVGASRLSELSRILDVPVSFFYDDMPDSIAGAFESPSGGSQDGPRASHEADSLSRRETLELVRA